MTQIYRAFAGLVPLLVIAFVVLLVLGFVGWLRLVGRGVARRDAGIRVLVDFILLGNLLGYAGLTLSRGYGRPYEVNVVPFYEIYQVVTTKDVLMAPVFEILGNLVLLLPAGAVIGLRWRRLDFVGRVFGVGLAVGLVAEVFQFASASGRVASITDVLLGGLGAAIGHVIVGLVRSSVAWWSSFRSVSRPGTDLPRPVESSGSG